MLMACFPLFFASSARAYTLLGMFPGSDGHTSTESNFDPDANVQLDAFNHWTGKLNVIVNVYGNPIERLTAFRTIWKEGAVPMLSWSGDTPEKVASGADDGELTADALAVKEWLFGDTGCSPGATTNCNDRRLYIRYDYEMNVTSSPWSPCNAVNQDIAAATGVPAEKTFILAWRHVHDIFTSEGLDNTHVAWVFSAGASDTPGCSAGDPANTYPANPAVPCGSGCDPSAYVDWLGIDGYGGPGDSTGTIPSFQSVVGPMVTELRSPPFNNPQRPLGIDEVGVSSLAVNHDPVATLPAKNQWIADYFPYLSSANLEMALWFNDNQSGQTEAPWAIFDYVWPADPDNQLPSYGDQTDNYFCSCNGLTYTYYGFSAYKTGVQASSVIGGSFTNPNPRILTDTQFLGQ
jgi:hypothetical protein